MKTKTPPTIDWLKKKRGYLSLSAIERSANIPAGVLSKAIRGVQPVAEKHLDNLAEVLKEYGYE